MQTSFEKNGVIYSFIDKTDRPEGGGYDRWSFNINGIEYFFDCDTQYISKKNEFVGIVEFYSNKNKTEDGPWELTNCANYHATRVFRCIQELLHHVWSWRKFSYISFSTEGKLFKICCQLTKKYKDVTDKILKDIEVFFCLQLQTAIDAGYVQTRVIELKEENRSGVEPKPVSDIT